MVVRWCSMFSLSCFFKTESVIPELNETRPNIIKPTETISVGNLGTSPVFKYSVKTGINKINDRLGYFVDYFGYERMQ